MNILLNNKPQRAWFVLVAFLFFIGLTGSGGYYFGRQFKPSLELNDMSEEKHEGGYKLINPLLECKRLSSYSEAMSKLRGILEDEISLLIQNRKASHISIYLRDLNNGPWIGINDKETFSPASLMKVPILISYLKLAEEDNSLLNKKLLVTMSREDALYQNIVPEAEVKTGQEYTVWELLEYAIRYSDNLAANTLLANIDPSFLDQTYSDLEISIPTEGNLENFITVNEYASFFRVLFNSSYLNREMSEKALELLSLTDFDNGLVAGVPPYIVVAHKFGERRLPNSLQLHDCGIIYHSPSPYLLCIMTRGDDFEQMASVIKDLSSLSFKEFEAQ